jgi:hypothetical protein
MDLRTGVDGETIVRFLGRGWGHGIGLCQNGAYGLARSLANTVITTYGRDVGVASTLFYRDNAPGKVGRQMQTWVRRPEGWRVEVLKNAFQL